MNRLQEFFAPWREYPEFRNPKRGPKFFMPVIHLPAIEEARELAHEQALNATRNGADGIWLISHGELEPMELIEVAYGLKASSWFRIPIGLNFLSLTHDPAKMIYLAAEHGIDLLWSDATGSKEEIVRAKAETGWDGLYCGAFAFKHQEHVANEDIPAVLARAFEFMDVPSTSGPATGIPLDQEKARISREAAGNRPIGVFSGVTAENVEWQLPYFDLFGVSSSLSLNGDWYRHDPAKIRVLADKIHAYKPEE